MLIRKFLILFVIIILGLTTGFGLRELTHQPINRAERAVSLFQHFCLPIKSHSTRVNPDNFERLKHWPGEPLLAEPKSALVVSYNDDLCFLDDRLQYFSNEDRQLLVPLLEALVLESYPGLTERNDYPWAGPLNRDWEQFPSDDPRYWGISLISFGDIESRFSRTTITIRMARP